MFRRTLTRAVTLATVLTLLMSSVALADDPVIDVDGDILTPFTKSGTIAFGNVCANTSTTKPVGVAIDRQSSGTNVYANSSTVTFAATSSNSKVTATNPASVNLPSTWSTAGNGALSDKTSTDVTVASGTVAGLISATVTITGSGSNSSGGAVSRTATVTVTATVVTNCDTTAPTLSLPANITAEATASTGAAVTFSATASDASPASPAVTCAPTSGSTFPFGETTVNCSATDAAGNTRTGSFKVTVVDTTAPVVSVPDSITQEAADSNGAAVAWTGATANDIVDGGVAAICDYESGATFPLGETTVTCTATDEAGNEGSNSFTITVSDTTAPTLLVPGDITEEATGPSGAVVTFTASGSDSVDADVDVVCEPASGSTFGITTTYVECTATDDSGNETTDNFNVTVEDTTGPEVTVPGPITEEATSASGAAVTFSASAEDIVDGDVAVNCDYESGATFPLGETTVTCSASDSRSNTGSNLFTITVVDTTAPELTLPEDLFIEATSAAGAAATFTPTATDAVDATPTIACLPLSGSTFALGETTVNCTASDDSGNQASGSFLVTVEDTTPPVLIVPANMTVEATGPSGAVATYSASASDIVDGALTPTCAPASGATFALGPTTVECTATDAADNTGEASFSVTVVDTTAPVLSLPPNIAVAGTGVGGAVVSYTASANDLVDGKIGANCSPASGSTFTYGTTTVSCTATDAAGNTSAAGKFTVTVSYGRSGFYSPVDMTPAGADPVLNMIKGGQTVPLKFEVFAGATEITSTSVVKSYSYKEISCSALGTTLSDDIEQVTTGGTSLRYDSTGGQFIQNWQTPKTTGRCYLATVTLTDDSTISAYFKTK